jgi:hypothetical protein
VTIPSDIWSVGKEQQRCLNSPRGMQVSNNVTIPSDIWDVGKEPIAMFEFTMWHASSDAVALLFGNNLLISSDKKQSSLSSSRLLTGWGLH